MRRSLLWCIAGLILSNVPARAWQSERDTIAQLMQRLEESEKRLAESERRIQALEQKLGMASPEAAPAAPPAADAEVQAAIKAAQAAAGAHHGDATQGHNMQLPGGGPVLNIRGFFDFNFGTGSIANPLVFPISDNGCGTCGNAITPPHSAFQAGEFDLFMTSRLSDHLNFLAELVLGPSTNNEFAIDIERYQLTYSKSRYFSASAGRFHTSIGYYNTAYHHGNWFSTAEGRPIMYLFEDSGGILPVHMVGVSLTGEVPHTDSLGLHWVAELGNGLSSNPAEPEGVQNFYSDRNYKATNFAAFIRPRVLPGLQVGASWYHDGLRPSQAENPLPIPEVRQNIYSAHVVYFSPNWEFMNEGVLLSNHTLGAREPFRSPMAYTQVARKLGIYKPYFRFQYADDNAGDPVNFLKGLYYGPSVGVRVDFSDYAAFKLQYNRLLMGRLPAANGLNAQVAFTF